MSTATVLSERIVLGTMLRGDDPGFTADTLDRLTPAAFTIPAHRTVFIAIARTADAGTVDLSTVMITLESADSLPAVGGFDALSAAVQESFTSTAPTDHVARIADRAAVDTRRQALDRLVRNAAVMGANAVVSMRFDSSEMAGTNWAALAPVPTTTMFLPARSMAGFQAAVWSLEPSKLSKPGILGQDHRLTGPWALITALTSRLSREPSARRSPTRQRLRVSSQRQEVTLVSNRMLRRRSY